MEKLTDVDAAVLEIEDGEVWDAVAAFDSAVRLERQARALGDDLLVQRARLCRVTMLMRTGDPVVAVRNIWGVHRWADQHRETRLQARVQMVWSALHYVLGDAAKSLECALRSVELLDETATSYMRVWHRLKLADALAGLGSMEAARVRYAHAEEQCHRYDRPDLLLWVLNNHAYMEFANGDLERAERLADRLREAAAELKPAQLDTIGQIEIGNGRFARAERTLLLCLERCGDGREEEGHSLAGYLLTLARARRGLGAYDRAQSSLDESRALCDRRDLGHVLVQVHEEQAELYAARGEHAAAFASFKEFHRAYVSRYTADQESQARTRQALFETAEAREEARRDPLTGLRNRRFVDERLPALIDGDPSLTVALVDVDHFKRINDELSHDVGDQVLVTLSQLLVDGVASSVPDGFAARLGGEEFLLVLPRTPLPDALSLVDRIRETVSAHPWEMPFPVTISAGLASVESAPTRTQAAVVAVADRNLYAAKRSGRNRVMCETLQPTA
ncbi:GGDEF domain-containing protein [Actinoplanes couchii]|uniref:GGDEF domain-containing protein n=1 Tax=Actinoplanes couchii TaxID=403638 RepID=A0ABQ3XET9_9ACTN|nr:GGDEF domain-containing protein [Actinoplanes couchii]MDR6319878.1 diguanylate cyclase (GGDEF)-like protein [Actinoplanes couchii]GID57013.1 hypothetical protein Aco03nite_054170 [Actinoplanes couchii]